ncbi:MAG: MBOAT family O-acyltransferase [Bdellovibrionota bacterium]|jgi:alginate O-acetyltransferase complex protein AlgI
MVFSSFLFIFCFLPLCLASYLLTPKRYKNITLLIWSLLFYAWGTWSFFPVFIGGCAVDFLIAHLITRSKTARARHLWVTLSVVLNLGILFYYKYANFFIHEVNALLSSFGVAPAEWHAVILPIGISFITFQRISYVIDVYRDTVAPARNFFDYLLYIAFFPQLIAGPIIRYHDIAQQLISREHSIENVWQGLSRFCIGLAKKVLLADVLGNITANVDKLGPDTITLGYAWLGVICYGFQLYFDFSGYSDMAIGLGRIFGFKFLENFDRPYTSQTFSEFWRRWHISLSRVMRDYLYIPLGGNRVGPIRSIRNLWIVFLLSGFWHGANWTFIFFGAYHGLFLTLDKFGWGNYSKQIATKRFGRTFNIFLTFFFVQIGWVFFKSKSIAAAWTYLGYMFNPRYLKAEVFTLPSDIIHNAGMFVFILSVTIFLLQLCPEYDNFLAKVKSLFRIVPLPLLRFISCAVTIILCGVVLSATRFTPFIYFQF